MLILKKPIDYSAISIDSLEEEFEAAARKFGVDYDGYERPVG